VSYETLNTQANRLAHALLARGLGADQLVGIALERSLDMVVSLLAVLKAGAAYVPLDPDYPAQRLAHMVQDSGLRWVLTQRGLRPVLPVSEHVCVVELDQFDTQNQPGHNLAVAVHEEQLAYVIYTSGSTGLPKGVGNRHVALLNRLQWMQAEYGLSQDDVVLQKTPFSFDVSVWEFFWPLIQGASLVLARPGEHKDPSRLVQTMVRHGVTTLHFVPSMLQAFMQHDSVRHCTSVRRILCSGEALPAEACQQVLALLPTVQLHNLYGPTEAAIDVTSWTCSAGHLGTIPIGHPIWGMQVYVLDGGMNLTPSGVAGELYLGGVGLARGYENRTELTAERFVADPFSDTGARLYRTGDLVRWNEAGQLEYLGRLDHQVKVRGFRIELGEVESQLLSLDGVREAVVVARSGPQGMQLVGYVSGDVSGLTLREQLSSQLPDYMVPSVIMVLEALPLNANGKIDRKALPEPEFASGQAYEAPQGELETTLATIWSQVLGVEQVGRQVNFFDLGGHSLLLVQLHEQMGKTLDAKVSVMDLFRYSTIQAQADFIRRADAAKPGEDERASIGAQAQRRKQALLRRKQLVQQG
ncbi:amino acid adenylation domain-containing protein, partial [Alcaligenes faecalis]|uniref:amino acid adenylation domain-containing protein n=1 Tax=Alcaligenes faecalis TaxID=511 RepID=UPI002932085E